MCFSSRRAKNAIICAPLFVLFASVGHSQSPQVLKLDPVEKITAKAGSTVKVSIPFTVDEGYHVNSNKPADEFLIPLKLTWGGGSIEYISTTNPKPRFENYPFSSKPVSVFTGDFQVVAVFKIAKSADAGVAQVAGKLHYQACNERMCLTPKTMDVSVPLEIVK